VFFAIFTGKTGIPGIESVPIAERLGTMEMNPISVSTALLLTVSLVIPLDEVPPDTL